MDFFLCVVGMVLIIEGVPYFAFPAKMKEFIRKVAAASDASLHRIGLALMAAGLILVALGRR